MLNVDQLFFTGLKESAEVTSIVGNRIFDTSRNSAEEERDIIPYIIVTYDGGSSDGGDKDNRLAPINQCQVSVMMVAKTREALAALSDTVYDANEVILNDDTLYAAHDNWNFSVDNASASASQVQYDMQKDCYFQSITYNCYTSKR